MILIILITRFSLPNSILLFFPRLINLLLDQSIYQSKHIFFPSLKWMCSNTYEYLCPKFPQTLASLNSLGDFQAHLLHTHHYIIISINLYWNLSLLSFWPSLEFFKFLKKYFWTEKVFKKGNTVCISPSKREEKERCK